jgi:hypothetical protein
MVFLVPDPPHETEVGMFYLHIHPLGWGVIAMIFASLAAMLFCSLNTGGWCNRHSTKKRLVISWKELIIPGRKDPLRCRSQQLCCPACEKEK